MNNEDRKKFSDTVLREFLEKLSASEPFRRQLEGFSDLPPARVAERLVKQFENLLSAQLRDLLVKLIEQDIRAEKELSEAMKAQEEEKIREANKAAVAREKREAEDAAKRAETEARKKKAMAEADVSRARAADETTGVLAGSGATAGKSPAQESIMEHFGTREAFPTLPLDFQVGENDWIYLYGFCYAPDTTGKGVPSRKLDLKGFDRKNEIFLLDYGDIRLYASKITVSDFMTDKGGRPTLDPQKSVWFKYDHEKTINLLRTAEVIVPINAWSIFHGMESVSRMIEDRYVDLLRTLIDAHDATEWEVEIFAFDDRIIKLPIITQEGKVRSSTRESKHPPQKTRDVKHVERLIFREKSIAQEIHSSLLYYAQRGKLDHMIRLDSAFMNDWKSILVCRYTVPKDKRRKFCEGINTIYDTFRDYDLMVRVINPTAFIRLSDS